MNRLNPKSCLLQNLVWIFYQILSNVIFIKWFHSVKYIVKVHISNGWTLAKRSHFHSWWNPKWNCREQDSLPSGKRVLRCWTVEWIECWFGICFDLPTTISTYVCILRPLPVLSLPILQIFCFQGHSKVVKNNFGKLKWSH